jgi:molybdopterin converting factor subunit 1
MVITVQLFAILRDRAGLSQTTLQLQCGATVQSASMILGERFPAIQPFLSKLAYAVNQQYVPSSAELHEGDELALIPPVSGG